MLAQDSLLEMASYVVNVKSKGKVHLSIGVLEKGGHKVKCGWYITKSTSLVFGCHRIKYGELCKRCFKTEGDEKGQDDEEIEQFPDNS